MIFQNLIFLYFVIFFLIQVRILVIGTNCGIYSLHIHCITKVCIICFILHVLHVLTISRLNMIHVSLANQTNLVPASQYKQSVL